MPHPSHLVQFEQMLYVSDDTRLSIVKINSFNASASNSEIMKNTQDGPIADVTLVHALRQPVGTGDASCTLQCEHFCVVTHVGGDRRRGFKCQCDSGFELRDDLRSCRRTCVSSPSSSYQLHVHVLGRSLYLMFLQASTSSSSSRVSLPSEESHWSRTAFETWKP